MDPIRTYTGQACSLIAHSAACLLFMLELETFGFPPFFNVQVIATLGVSACLTLATLLVKQQSSLLLILCLQLFAALVIGYPMGESLSVELVLFAGLLALASDRLRYPASLLFCLAVIAASVLSQREVAAWGTVQPRPGAADILILAAVLTILLIGLTKMNRTMLKHRGQQDRNRQLEIAVQQLASANLGFQDYAHATEERSRISERQIITREIHDIVGYTLTNITMMMEDAIDSTRQNDCNDILPLIVNSRDQARNGHEEIRQALRRLRFIEAGEVKGLNAIHRLVRTFESATGVRIDVEYTNAPPDFPGETELCLYRLIQEGMTNSFRHGHASRIRIVLSEVDGSILLIISDNGGGTHEIVEGLGISGMKERVGKLGGEIEFKSSKGGFELIARIPLPAAPDLPGGA